LDSFVIIFLLSNVLQSTQYPVTLLRAFPTETSQATQEIVFGDQIVRVGQSQTVLEMLGVLGFAIVGHLMHFLVEVL